MKVYNQDKTKILENYDLNLGKLVADKLIIKHPEVKAVEGKGYYKTIKEYSNGGKDVEWVDEVKPVKYQPEYTETEDITVYVPFTKEELKQHQIENLRAKRDYECFSVVNRGKLWYDTLTDKQLEELSNWYKKWLDVTETLEEPQKPTWLN